MMNIESEDEDSELLVWLELLKLREEHLDTLMKISEPAFITAFSKFLSEQSAQDESAVEAELKEIGLGESEIVWLKNKAASNYRPLSVYVVFIGTAYNIRKDALAKADADLSRGYSGEDYLGDEPSQKRDKDQGFSI